MATDNAKGNGTETASVAAFTDDQRLVMESFGIDPNETDPQRMGEVVDLLKSVAAGDPMRVSVSVGIGDGNANPEPAYESGPHLEDPENRAAKKQQMIDHGWTTDHEALTDDMYAILEEGN